MLGREKTEKGGAGGGKARARALPGFFGLGLALALALSLARPPCAALALDSRPGDLGQLDWGNPAGGPEWSSEQLAGLVAKPAAPAPSEDALGRALRKAVARASATLYEKTPVLDSVHFEGTLASDPAYKRGAAATGVFEDAMLWALCARVARPPLRDRCGAKAARLALDWMAAYAPSGNPIDESRFVPLLQAIDLLVSADATQLAEPLKDSNHVRALKAWVRTFARAGDRFFSELPPQSDRRSNNWMSWRLLIRGMAAAVGADPALQMSTVQMIREHLAANLADDGSSLDFHERDALHYHVYDLEALTQAYLYLPWAIDAQGAARILKALQFLEPYVSGAQKHVEFVGSKVAFDAARRKAGYPEFQNAPWKPERARRLMALARSRFPSVRSWSGGESAGESAYLAVLAELYREK